MRTTDELTPQQPWKPFGERVVNPPPAKPEWTQVPDARPGVQQDKDGHFRTYMPDNQRAV
jgi:hypothetical protein